MSGAAVSLTMLAGMLALMAIRVPIALAMFIPGALGYLALGGWPALASQFKGMVFARFSNYDLSVIPLFLLMGAFATQGGLSRGLFGFANAAMAPVRGGMAMAATLACAAFGTVCGSSVATVSTVTQVAYPEMKRHGYAGRLSTATLATSGTLGILIPPSVPLVIYGILAEQNIAKLFAAALLPGAIAMLGYLAVIAVLVRVDRGAAPGSRRLDFSELRRNFVDVLPVAIVFVTVFGGIYGQVFTVNEGAAFGAGAMLVAALLKGELGWAGFRESCVATALTSAMIFLIFVGADIMNSALALSRFPEAVARFVTDARLPPMVVLCGVLVMYVILGSVMDELSMVILTIPILLPAVLGMDFHGLAPTDKAIWFGILVLMVVEFGLVAPPVGLNVYIVNSLARDVPMTETYRGVLPFLGSDLIRVALLLAFPPISLWLVHRLFGSG
jgi:tripartite ATP-independent transporter DctM subunit